MSKTTKKKTDIYQQSMMMWDERIGSAKSQLKNWQLACVAVIVLCVIQLAAILFLINKQQNHVFIAEVKPGHNVVSIEPVFQDYQPTMAQNEFFISQFIHDIMSLPLDPVVARSNWLAAYSFAEGDAKRQLTEYALRTKPFNDIGLFTKVVEIKSMRPIGGNSFELNWSQKVIDSKGKTKATNVYSGVFTLSKVKTPDTVDEILINPLGIRIVYFTVNKES